MRLRPALAGCLVVTLAVATPVLAAGHAAAPAKWTPRRPRPPPANRAPAAGRLPHANAPHPPHPEGRRPPPDGPPPPPSTRGGPPRGGPAPANPPPAPKQQDPAKRRTTRLTSTQMS